MADKYISELSKATELKNEAQFIIEQDGQESSVSGEQLKEFIGNPEVVQDVGDSTEAVMSQKAVTTELGKKIGANEVYSPEDQNKILETLGLVSSVDHVELPYLIVASGMPGYIADTGILIDQLTDDGAIKGKSTFLEIPASSINWAVGWKEIQYVQLYSGTLNLGGDTTTEGMNVLIGDAYEYEVSIGKDNADRVLNVSTTTSESSISRNPDIGRLLLNNNLYAFGIGLSSNLNVKEKRHYTQIIKNGELVFDIIPVFRYVDNKLLWFDRASGNYWGEDLTLYFSYDGEIPTESDEDLMFTSQPQNFKEETKELMREKLGLTSVTPLTIGSPKFYTHSLIPADASLHTMQIEELYQIYDDLVVSYPMWIKRVEDIGIDAAENPIRAYEVGFQGKWHQYAVGGNPAGVTSPAEPTWEESLDYTQVMVSSGIHGDEKTASYGTALFFKKLVESSEDWAMYIKSNLIIQVAPCINIAGFNVTTRVNADGVDVNRDAVAKETNESQAILKWVTLHKEKSQCHFDVHSTGGWYNWTNVFESSPYATEVKRMTAKFSAYIKPDWDTTFNKPDFSPHIFSVSNPLDTVWASEISKITNRPSIITETVRDYINGSQTNNMASCKFTIDMLANFLQFCVPQNNTIGHSF